MLGTVTALRRYPVKSMRPARDRADPRCAVPTLAHGDLPRDTEALRVLARHNRVGPLAGLDPEPCAGVYAEVLSPGRIRTGDTVCLP